MSSQMEIMPAKGDEEVRRSKGFFLSGTACAALVIAVVTMLVAVPLLVYYFAPTPSAESDDKPQKNNVREILSSGIPATDQPQVQQKPKDIRLPDNTRPVHYDVELQPVMDPQEMSPDQFEFTGYVRILVECVKPTDQIVVHAKNLTIDKIKVAINDSSVSDPPLFRAHEIDTAREFLKIKTTKALGVGQFFHVEVTFKAPLKPVLSGLYLSTYTTPDDQKKYIAATQFQPTDARRAFPCYDEPAKKATFTVTLVRKQSMTALSNMALERSSPRTNGYIADTFKKSVVMPTYLLAFVICDFDYLEENAINPNTGTSVKVRVYAPRHVYLDGHYALQQAVRVLPYFENFFNLPFPLEKLDMVAVPDFAAGAMENWGLVLYRETALLYNPKVSSAGNKKRVAVVVAHELAHQWFGNIVSPAWWDDLWLNEGFASYMEYLGVNYTEPSWEMLDQYLVDDFEDALSLDSLKSSHPIQVPVGHPDEINEIFDKISYSKPVLKTSWITSTLRSPQGSAVIRMMRNMLGDQTFRRGLELFLAKFKYGNARTVDLWASLDDAAKEANQRISVKNIMDTWTLQMNYPVMTVTRDYAQNAVTVSQDRFLINAKAPESNQYSSPYGYKWDVEFQYVWERSNNVVQWDAPKKAMLTRDDQVKQLEAAEEGKGSEGRWILGNPLVFGYYRVNYDAKNWELIIATLNNLRHTVVAVRNRAQLIDDAFNLAQAGRLNITTALDTTTYLSRESEYLPWSSFVSNVGYIRKMFARKEAYGDLQKYLRKLSTQPYQEVTFAELSGETILRQFHRVNVLATACNNQLVLCINSAKDLYKSWIQRPNNNPINVNLKTLVYCTAIRYGDYEEWKFAFDQYQKTTTASEKSKLLYSLACTERPWILNLLLKYTLNETVIKRQDGAYVIANIARNPVGSFVAWDFFRQNFDTLKNAWGGQFFAWGNLIKAVISNFNTKFELKMVNEFKTAHPDFGSGERAWKQAVEQIAANIQWMEYNYEVVVDWLKRNS